MKLLFSSIFILAFLFQSLGLKVNVGDDITTGGLSSGAFMAVQTHVALSSKIKGAASFAGGPYYCANGDFATANTNCMALGTGIDLDHIESVMKDYESKGKIDPISNLEGARAFIFSGTSDYTVNPKVNMENEAFYTRMGANVLSIYDFASAHTMPTEQFGAICTVSMPPYIGKCSYNGALTSLQQLHPSKISNKKGSYMASNLFTIKQNTAGTGMGPEAYVYVPSACQSSETECSLHIVFHGCLQTIKDIQTQYVEDTGYNPIAESNNMIILYPQAVSGKDNPYGCWDWWGYLNQEYATKDGVQIAEVNRLIEVLKSGEVGVRQVYIVEEVREEVKEVSE